MSISIHLSSAVRDALDQHHPIVALESTLITHGLPRRLSQLRDFDLDSQNS